MLVKLGMKMTNILYIVPEVSLWLRLPALGDLLELRLELLELHRLEAAELLLHDVAHPAVGLRDQVLPLLPHRLVAVVEERRRGLQRGRDLDDLGAEGPEAGRHVGQAAGHHLRVLLSEPLDELLDDALVHLDLAEHEQDLAGQLLRLGLGGAQALGDDAVAYVANLRIEKAIIMET